jgi:outer membrane protein insertion porin family
VFAPRARVDYGRPFSNDEVFPLYRRFFGGGIDSLRGFSSRSVSPEDRNGSKYGGSSEMILNFDLIFPLFNSVGLKGLVFYDTGNVYDDGQSPFEGALRQNVGWGIRWKSPIAPIRIEFGFPLHRQAGEGGMQTQFSFGNPE